MGCYKCNKSVKKRSYGGTRKRLYSIFSIIIIFSSILVLLNPIEQITAQKANYPKIEFIEYSAVIDNNYAITEISELVKNPYNDSIDQTFTFQIPEKAYISNFSLQIANNIFYAQIVPKNVGKQKFQESVINGTDAGLVEAKGKNIFSYSVSLSPYQEILVGLRYEQFLEKKLGGYEYIIPFSGLSQKSVSKFSIDILVKSPLFLTNMDVENYVESTKLEFLSKNFGTAYYESTNTPQVDFILHYKLLAPPINGTIMNYYYNEEEYFMHVFSPQREDLGGAAMDKEIIFVLDKSGSMNGKKIQQLKQAFAEIIEQLPGNDSFDLIMFDHSIKQYSPELLEANSENKDLAVNYINGIDASGSTNINEALVTALEMFQYSEIKVPIIIMLTDGLPTAGVTNPNAIRDNIKNKNTAAVAIFSLGFGYDVDFEFLKAMSLENYGLAIRIYEGEDASEQITNFYDTISTPLLRNLQFTYSDGAYQVYPTKLDQLFEGAEAVVVGKYRGESREIKSTVEATSWEGSKTFKESFKLESDSEYSFIPRLWAYQKIKYLLNELTVQGTNDSIEDNITELALEFGFVTPFTSLLVLVNPSSIDDNDNNDIANEQESQSNPNNNDDKTPRSYDNRPSTDPFNSEKKEKDDGDLGWFDGDGKSGEDEDVAAMGMSVLPCLFIMLVIIITIVIIIVLVVSKKKR